MTLTTDSTPEDNYLLLGWMLAGKLAEWLNMKVGVIQLVPDGPYMLLIDLPSGQVSVQIPNNVMEGKWKSWTDQPEDRPFQKELDSVMDCLYGVLISKHVLLIPQDKKEETE